jgi:hypothetical protein
MRCLSAVFALQLAALVWLPSAAFAQDGLAIAHPPSWDQSLAIAHATGAPLDDVDQANSATVDAGPPSQSSDHYAHAPSKGGGATSAPATDLPLAITTFPTSE